MSRQTYGKPARNIQFCTLSHTCLFKQTPNALILKIFDQARQKLHQITASSVYLSQWRQIQNAQTLLNLFIQSNLIPADSLPPVPQVDLIDKVNQLILLAKSQIEIDYPDELKCPITLDVFEGPVMDEHGHTFEKAAIVAHLEQHRDSCPLNRQPIGSLTLNQNIKDAIERLQKQDLIPTFRIFKNNNPGKYREIALSCVEQQYYEEAFES